MTDTNFFPSDCFDVDSFEVVCDSRDRDRWLHKRSGLVCASDVACLFGEGYMSALQLWGEKTGKLEPEIPDARKQELFDLGHAFEPLILRLYSEKYALRPVKPHGLLLRHRHIPYLGATLDATTETEEYGTIPLDAKLTNAFRMDDWKDGEPLKYYWQAQAQALVMGASAASLACYIGHPSSPFVWLDVPRCDTDCERIERRAAEFMRAVERREPPPINNWHRELKKTAKSLNGESNGGTVDLHGTFLGIRDNYLAAKEDRRKAQKTIDVCEAKIIMAIGDAEIGNLPDGYRFKHGRYEQGEKAIKAYSYSKLTYGKATKKKKGKGKCAA